MKNGNFQFIYGLLTGTILVIILILMTMLTDTPISVFAQTGYPPPPIGTPTPENLILSNLLFVPKVSVSIPIPQNSRSYYIWNNNGLNYQGFLVAIDFASNQQNDFIFVFLDFGKPNRNINLVYGTVQYNNTVANEDEIKADVISFSEGFYICNNHQDNLIVAVGTNNSGGTVTDTIAYGHGERDGLK